MQRLAANILRKQRCLKNSVTSPLIARSRGGDFSKASQIIHQSLNVRRLRMHALALSNFSTAKENEDVSHKETPLNTNPTSQKKELSIDTGYNTSESSPLPTKEEKQALAKDIFNVLSVDYEKIYSDKTMENNILFNLLFREGINQHEIITARPQMAFIDGSLDISLIKKERFVFFPTQITQQIFKRCESLHKNQNILIISQEGLGKSHSIALYVYLKRAMEDCRIIFIHNYQNFIDKPFKYLLKQFPIAFKNEFADPEIHEAFLELEKVFEDDTLSDDNRVIKLDNFITLVSNYLEKAKIPSYLIIDEANVIALKKNKEKIGIVNDLISSITLLSGIRIIQIGSNTAKKFNDRIHEHTECQLQPPNRIDYAIKEYIHFLSRNTQLSQDGDGYTLSDDQVQKLIEVTGYSLFNVRLFFQRNYEQVNFDKRMEIFKDQRKSEIGRLIQDFLDQDDERYLHMSLALEGLKGDGQINSFLKKAQVDERLFFIDTKTNKRHTISAISPLAIDALQGILLCPYNIDKTIQKCWVFPITLGLLLENEVQKGFFYWLRKSMLYIRRKIY